SGTLTTDASTRRDIIKDHFSGRFTKYAANKTITTDSLAYLTSITVILQLEKLNVIKHYVHCLKKIVRHYPLARYASREWIDSAKACENADVDNSVRDITLKFFRNEQAYFLWGRLYRPDEPYQIWQFRSQLEYEMASPLYYSSFV